MNHWSRTKWAPNFEPAPSLYSYSTHTHTLFTVLPAFPFGMLRVDVTFSPQLLRDSDPCVSFLFLSFISIWNMFSRVVHSFRFSDWVRDIDIYGKLQSYIFIFCSNWRSEDGRAYAVHSTHVEIFRVKSWHNYFIAISSLLLLLLLLAEDETNGAHLTPISVLVCVFHVFHWQRQISTVYWKCAFASIHPNAKNRIEFVPFKVSAIHKCLGIRMTTIQMFAIHPSEITEAALNCTQMRNAPLLILAREFNISCTARIIFCCLVGVIKSWKFIKI